MDLSELLDLVIPGAHQGGAWRNIYTCDPSQHLFDDLVPVAEEARLHDLVEMSRPLPQRRASTGHARSFVYLPEETVLTWPRFPWSKGRWGDGEEYGVWYGSLSDITSLREVHYHLRRDAQEKLGQHPTSEYIAFHRALFLATIRAPRLVDLRPCYQDFVRDLSSDDYAVCNAVGRHLWSTGTQGLLSKSARDTPGENLSLFEPSAILSDQRIRVVRFCFYRGGACRITHSEDITNTILPGE